MPPRHAATGRRKPAGKANRILAQAEVGESARALLLARGSGVSGTHPVAAAPAEIRRGHENDAAAQGDTRRPPQRRRARRAGAHAARRARPCRIERHAHRAFSRASIPSRVRTPRCCRAATRTRCRSTTLVARVLDARTTVGCCSRVPLQEAPDNLTLVSCAAGSARRGPRRGRLITCALRAARAGANFRWADPRHG